MDSLIKEVSQHINVYLNKKYPTITKNINKISILEVLNKSKKKFKKSKNIKDFLLKNKNFENNLIKKIEKIININITKNVNQGVNISYDKYLNNFDPLMNTKIVNEYQNLTNYNNISANESKKTKFYQNINDNNGILRNYQESSNNIHNFNNNSEENIKIKYDYETVKQISYIIIDSKDRDRNKFKHANDYEIELPISMKIKSIELIDVIILKSDKDIMSSDNRKQYPYLLLEINNLKSNIIGTNNTLNSSFAILRKFDSDSKFKYYNDINIKKTIKQNKLLDKLHIKFKIPTGELFNFGFHNNMSIETVNLLRFKIEHV